MDPLSQTERDWGQKLAIEPGSECLEAETLLQLAAKGRKAPQAERLYAHLAECPNCRKALKELREVELLQAALPKKGHALPRFLPWAAGLAAAAALVWVALQFVEMGPGMKSNPAPLAKEKPAPIPGPAPNTQTVPRLAPSNIPSPELRPETPARPKSSFPRRHHRLPSRSKAAPTGVPEIARPVETMDAHIGWSRDEISGEVLSANVTTGEVVPPNVIQGEVNAKRGG